MAKVQAQGRAAMRPASTRHRPADVDPRLWPTGRHAPRRGPSRRAASGQGSWQARFLKAFADRGFDKALLSAGIPLGDTVLARAEDEAFRQAVERIGAERLATAELQMVDLLLQRLSAPDVGEEKAALLLWQSLREDRRKPTPRSGGEKAGAERVSAPSAGPSPAERAVARAAEVARLIAVVEARLAAAEADGKKP